MPREKVLLIGAKFNKLTILNKTSRTDSNRNCYYLCKCECGIECEIRSCNLRNGHTKSCGCLNVELPGQASWNKLFWDYQIRARNKKLAFELSFEKFKEIASQNCDYCGEEPRKFNIYMGKLGPSRIKGNTQTMIDRSWINANGVDRVDNSVGYIESNCVSCCSVCNSFKSDYTQEEFLLHSAKITNFQLRKGVL